MDSTTCGAKSATSVNRSDTLSALTAARPKLLRMRSISRTPQYWAMNTPAPELKPNMTRLSSHAHWPAMPTAASAVSPSTPIMMVSTSVNEQTRMF